MQWTKCEICTNHTSIGSYLFQANLKKFPEKDDERICVLCGKPGVVLYQSYDELIAAIRPLPAM